MIENNCQNHRLDGLKDYTEKKSVASEQSDKIRDSEEESAEILNSILELI